LADTLYGSDENCEFAREEGAIGREDAKREKV
jgi:hypothetical protein